MAVEQFARELQREQCQMAVAKRNSSRNALEEVFGGVLGATNGSWLLPCRHEFRLPAATWQLSRAEQDLGFPIPAALKEFFKVSNGADLFSLHYYYAPKWDVWIPQYRILGTDELPSRHQELVESFRACTRKDPDYKDTTELNYLVYCDIGEGNYLAIVLTGPETGHIIHIDREFGFGYLPYDEWTRQAYADVAVSLEAWLERLVLSRGWNGYPREAPFINRDDHS
ncbi:MAG: SMI1/KNR4 family protein [Chloroflexi bacterium]|nr:SMI1/KNR4 family protein [Chloroflexota bacterium]